MRRIEGARLFEGPRTAPRDHERIRSVRRALERVRQRDVVHRPTVLDRVLGVELEARRDARRVGERQDDLAGTRRHERERQERRDRLERATLERRRVVVERDEQRVMMRLTLDRGV